MATPAIQTLLTDAQQVLNLNSLSEVRSTMAAALANANVGTPLNPNLTTQQLWDEFYLIVRQPESDIESIITNQLMKFLFAPPAPGGAGADQQVIFNDGGVLAGDPQFLWNKTTNLLTVTGSATITGDLTVNTNVLKVDTTNDRVGIGTASPATILDIQSAGGLFARIQNTTSTADAYLLVKNTTGEGFFGINALGPYIYTASALPIVFTTATSERYRIAGDGVATWSNVGGVAGTAMTLNSTGLGVGNASPAGALDLTNTGVTAEREIRIQNSTVRAFVGVEGTGGNKFVGSATNNAYFGTASTYGLEFATNNNVRMLIDTSGNVGIGVTPSAWGSNSKALQIGGGSASVSSTGAGSTASRFAHCAYFDNTNWLYQYTGVGPALYQVTGANAGSTHAWYIAPGGTAGNAITFTQAMTLDASGNLLVGTVTSPTGTKVGAITKLSGVSVEGTAYTSVSTTPVAIARSIGTGGLFFVAGFNTSGGAQGWWLVASTGASVPTVIASGNNTLLTVAFTQVSGVLNMNTTSGTLSVTAFAITN